MVKLTGTQGDNGWYKSAVQVNLNVIGGQSGLQKTEYSMDGKVWTRYTGKFTLFSEGYNTLYYRSTDKAGNVEPTRSVKINIDRAPPVIYDIQVSVNQISVNTNLKSGAIFQEKCGIQSATWNWGDGTTSAGIMSGNSANGAHAYQKPGKYSVTLTLKDMAGNARSSVYSYVTVTGQNVPGTTQDDRDGSHSDHHLSGWAGYHFYPLHWSIYSHDFRGW